MASELGNFCAGFQQDFGCKQILHVAKLERLAGPPIFQPEQEPHPSPSRCGAALGMLAMHGSVGFRRRC